MSTQSKSSGHFLQHKTQEQKTGLILLLAALVLGTLVRLLFILPANFPLNDGGLFYSMVRDLQANHFLIPAETSYNQGGLPFAYSPLAFYLIGGLNSLLGFSLLEQMRWLPLFFNLLCIPVFYHFARQLLRDPVRAGIAVLFFALLKPGYEWLIMGGGLTRSPAMLFSLLTLDRYLALIHSDDQRTRRTIAVAIFFALTFLSHLEIGWFTTYSLALLWFFQGRNQRNFISSIYIVLGTFVLTSPYWIQVLRYHTLQPFVEVLTSGGYDPRIILYELIYFFNFTEEMIFPILGLVAITGVIISLVKREYLLPMWLVLNIVLDARGVNRSDVIPAALLISVGIMDGLYYLIGKYQQGDARKNSPDSGSNYFFTRMGISIIFILCIQTIIATFLTRSMDQPLLYVLTDGDLKAMEWVRQNTPAEAKFISIPSSTWWQTDAVGEWFPALTGRINMLTVQGNEWSREYQNHILDYKDLISSIQSGTLSIDNLKQKYPDLSYIYLPPVYRQNTAINKWVGEALKNYPVVFQNKGVSIYALNGN
jgi:hypothetical protein